MPPARAGAALRDAVDSAVLAGASVEDSSPDDTEVSWVKGVQGAPAVPASSE